MQFLKATLQDGNGYVSTSELKFVMTKLDVFFTEAVGGRKKTTLSVTEQEMCCLVEV